MSGCKRIHKEVYLLKFQFLRRHIMSKALLLFCPLAVFYVVWTTQQQGVLDATQDYGMFFFVGVIGAIFANSTGAGGGVIFIPVFSGLGLEPLQSISTSFAIQCFGMTAGALTWWRYRETQANNSWPQFYKIVSVCTPFSISGLWLCQWLGFPPPQSMLFTFGLFSIMLGTALIFKLRYPDSYSDMTLINRHDFIALAGISFIGGIITAWLSVGVGELIATYLLFRKVNPVMSVAIAVIVSAFTVWGSAYIHFTEDTKTLFNIVIFAGPGAILGGLFARKLVLHLSAKKLKAFFGVWIILSGLTVLIFE